MKSLATYKLTRLIVALGALGSSLALSGLDGLGSWSDETLKREIEPVESPLEKLRALKH